MTEEVTEKVKKFYLYGFDMLTPMGNRTKSEPDDYDVTNQDLRFGFTEDWEGRNSLMMSISAKDIINFMQSC